MLGRTVTELMPFHRLDDWFSSEETFLTQTDALSARGGSPLRRTHAPPGSIPGQPALLRAINDRAALELLVEHGPLSRAQIGRLTGLSKPTASQLLARLEEAGLVIPIGPRAGGRTAQLYEVNPGAAYVGAMGSRRAQEKRRERLTAIGVTDEEQARLAAPIGLDLGATTSEETALSIMAEVVAVRQGRGGGRLSASGAGRIHEVGA